MGWEMVKLGDVARKTKSINPAKFPETVYAHHSIPAFDAGQPSFEAGSEIKSSKIELADGDVLLSKIVPHIARAWAVQAEVNGFKSIGSSEWMVFNDPRFLPDFLTHLFKSQIFRQKFMTTTAGVGGSLTRARPKAVHLIQIPLPPLEEQQRIAKILGTVEEAITDATTTFESISALRQSVFKKFVRPDHPTRELGEIVSIQSGGTPSKKKPEYWGGDIPWYSPKDFKARYLSDSIDHITELAVSNANAKILPGRIPAVVVRGMILAHSFPVAVLETPGAINQDVKALHLNEDSIYSVDFLAEALRANAQYALTKVLTSSHGTKRLETEELAKLPVPVMSKDDIKEFDRVFSCLTQLSNYRQEKVNRLHELYASLTSRAFTGEL